jgi:1,2-phenylacetyl-CoA epoxidase PaaB subunit
VNEEEIWEVFARRNREDRLEHVGAISAPGPELARVYAWQTYDEATWFEMVVVPRDAFHPVNREEQPFTLQPTPAT